MDMKTGSVQIEADDIKIRIWADANFPVYHVQINSPNDIKVNAEPEFWNRFDQCGFNNFDVTGDNVQENATNPTQDVRVDKNGQIIWYYAVGPRSVFKLDMQYYDVEDMIGKYPDPYIHNTFGNLLESPDLTLENGMLSGKGKRFDIRIHSLTKQTPDVSDWIKEIQKQAAKPINTDRNWEKHTKWWSDFWNRSWIYISDNTLPANDKGKISSEGYKTQRNDKDAATLVSQSYNVFRYLMACQSRGKNQTKFNGGLVTQPLRCTKDNIWKKVVASESNGFLISHEDDRDWGRRYTFQNQRLLYWPLLMSGDYDLIKPFFNYYTNLLPVRKAITNAWFEHEGAYYRENIEPTGAERDCGRDGKPLKVAPGENKGQGYYHSFYFTSGLEIVAMMLDYVNNSGDKKYSDTVLRPFAREVLLFFDKHYQRDSNEKLKLDPAMVLETYWIAVNPAPDIAGLQFCLDELLKLDVGNETDKKEWQRFRVEIPPVYLHKIKGRKAIAPAQEYKMKKNSENGELYPVFPFRLFGLAQGTEDIVEWTMENRTNKNSFDYKCWTQDQIHWAYAGNAKEAQEGLIHRFRHASTQCRFPVYGSQSPDSCPDFDHFGAGSTALQRMLIQYDGDKILLFPAWPKDWDVDFKLHVPGNTTVEAKLINGKVEVLNVTPSSRKIDVVMMLK
jgi:alpha-L-fucosidase 2